MIKIADRNDHDSDRCGRPSAAKAQGVKAAVMTSAQEVGNRSFTCLNRSYYVPHRLRDLLASWNRILAIFDPCTFLRSQGHDLPVRR